MPAWALGPWMSSNNWDSEAEIRRQVALTVRITVECEADGTMRIAVEGRISSRCTLVLTDPAVAVIVNGASANTGTLALAGVSLPAVVLNE